jgi:hypothetical protein
MSKGKFFACRDSNFGPNNGILEITAMSPPPALSHQSEVRNMRMLLSVTFPPEPFNTLVKEKKAGQIINQILSELKPETAYFTEENGSRGGMFVINVTEPSQIPFLAEPFFLKFNADCRFRVAITAEELVKADLDNLGEKWK